MQDLQQAARQTKALTKKKRGKAAMRRARKANPYQRAALPSPERVRARTKTDRFEVDQDREWVVVRSEPNKASRCAEHYRSAGLPVFEARQEERLVAENGKARVAQVPILRRLLFIGLASEQALRVLADNRYAQAVWARGEGSWIWAEREWLGSANAIRIGPLAMQKFADHITGHRRDDKVVGEIVQALFAVGSSVRIKGGPLASFQAVVEHADARRGRYRVRADIFGSATRVEIEENALEAA